MTTKPPLPPSENPANIDYAELAHRLAEALRLTQEYTTVDVLPPIDGWSWFDALRLYQDAENLNGRTYVFQPAGESVEHPTVWSDRPDIFWCTRCDCFHRTDFDHDWKPLDGSVADSGPDDPAHTDGAS